MLIVDLEFNFRNIFGSGFVFNNPIPDFVKRIGEIRQYLFVLQDAVRGNVHFGGFFEEGFDDLREGVDVFGDGVEVRGELRVRGVELARQQRVRLFLDELAQLPRVGFHGVASDRPVVRLDGLFHFFNYPITFFFR